MTCHKKWPWGVGTGAGVIIQIHFGDSKLLPKLQILTWQVNVFTPTMNLQACSPWSVNMSVHVAIAAVWSAQYNSSLKKEHSVSQYQLTSASLAMSESWLLAPKHFWVRVWAPTDYIICFVDLNIHQITFQVFFSSKAFYCLFPQMDLQSQKKKALSSKNVFNLV